MIGPIDRAAVGGGPFAQTAAQLLDQLPHASSSQLGVLRVLASAIRMRQEEIEHGVVVRRPHRPEEEVTRRSHHEDPPPPPPSSTPSSPRPPLVAQRPADGTIAVVFSAPTEESHANCFLAMPDGALLIGVGSRIQKWYNGEMATLAGGSESGMVNGSGQESRFDGVMGMALLASTGSVVVADQDNHVVRIVDPAGATMTFAGVGGMDEGDEEGVAATASLDFPSDVVIDAVDSSIYVLEEGRGVRIRKLAKSDELGEWRVSTLAGKLEDESHRDGHGANANFGAEAYLSLAPDRALIVGDTYNYALRRVDRDGNVATVAGDGAQGTRDGDCRQAQFGLMYGIAVASDGVIYVAEHKHKAATDEEDPCCRIRQLVRGVVSTLVEWEARDGEEECQLGEIASSMHLDEDNGHLFVCTKIDSMSRVITVSVPTSRERRALRRFPMVRLWALVQRERAWADEEEEDGEMSSPSLSRERRREREALCRLMEVPVVGVFARVLSFCDDPSTDTPATPMWRRIPAQ